MPVTGRLARVWVSGAAACLVLLAQAAGGLAASASAASRAASPRRPPVPSPGTSSELFGVACVSPANCWAVGDYGSNGTRLNQVLHWNGRTWSSVSVPQPGSTMARHFLDGVACPAPASCWAVGVYYKASGPGLNQALHWNGRTWSLVPTPDPRGLGPDGSVLFGVRCSGPGDCWAVGSYQRGTGSGAPVLTEALHWNGRRWSLVPAPSPGGNADHARSELADVRCTSPGNCWAVGDYGIEPNGASLGRHLTLILHWNGTRWSQVATPNPVRTGDGASNELTGVACASSASCWAVGSSGILGDTSHPSTFLNLALHWNGRRWSLVSTPSPGGTGSGAINALIDVTCTGPASCWAVGDFRDISGGSVNQALHWNGRNWSRVPTPDPGGLADRDFNVPYSVRCASPASCWAVGLSAPSGQPRRNQALHWNGTRWAGG